MNPVVHSKISASRRGGVVEDYLPVHRFLDCTKALCSDNRHRIMHTMWGVMNVVVPVFGHTIVNSDGKSVNVKDLCEQDHILPDYRNRFIPTLADFVDAIEDRAIEGVDFEEFLSTYRDDATVVELMLSPLSVTGQKKSLLITHNSWFVSSVLPKLFETKPQIRDFAIAPSQLFDNMRFELWMDNGAEIPQSARLTAGRVVGA